MAGRSKSQARRNPGMLSDYVTAEAAQKAASAAVIEAAVAFHLQRPDHAQAMQSAKAAVAHARKSLKSVGVGGPGYEKLRKRIEASARGLKDIKAPEGQGMVFRANPGAISASQAARIRAMFDDHQFPTDGWTRQTLKPLYYKSSNGIEITKADISKVLDGIQADRDAIEEDGHPDNNSKANWPNVLRLEAMLSKKKAKTNPRARRNPVHLHAPYGPGDKGKHRVLDQALDVAAMAKSIPVHKVYTFVSPANTPENAVAKIDVVLGGSRVASFLVKPKTHTMVMTAGPVDCWFHEAKYRTSADAIRKIAKWAAEAAGATAGAKKNPLTVNPRKAKAPAIPKWVHVKTFTRPGMAPRVYNALDVDDAVRIVKKELMAGDHLHQVSIRPLVGHGIGDGFDVNVSYSASLMGPRHMKSFTFLPIG